MVLSWDFRGGPSKEELALLETRERGGSTVATDGISGAEEDG
jgi:hypothetical protein